MMISAVPFPHELHPDEICGVILGSLDSAAESRALTREEYGSTVRSYIPNKTDEGKKKRDRMYDVFENYRRWKLTNDRFDLSDVVLRLIKLFRGKRGQHGDGGWEQLFSAVYLDEIQVGVF